jgi:hypothetical protein
MLKRDSSFGELKKRIVDAGCRGESQQRGGRKSVYPRETLHDSHQAYDLLLLVDSVETRSLQDGSHAKFMSGFE